MTTVKFLHSGEEEKNPGWDFYVHNSELQLTLAKIRKEECAGNSTQNSGRLVSGITGKSENSEMYACIYLQRIIETYNETEIEN